MSHKKLVCYKNNAPLLSAFIQTIKSLKEKDLYCPLYIVVPSALAKQELKKELAKELSKFLNIHLLTIFDLATCFLSEIEENGYQRLPFLGETLLLENFSQQFLDKTYFKEVYNAEKFLDILQSTIFELKEALISPSEFLNNINPKDEKLLEIGKIYQAYESTLKKNKLFDRKDIIPYALKENKKTFKDAFLLVYDLYDLNFSQKIFLNQCFTLFKSVNYFLQTDSNSHTYALKKWLDAQKFIIEEPFYDFKAANNLDTLKKNLFQKASANTPLKEDPSLALISAPNRTKEVYEISREILKLIAEKELYFSDITVVLRNFEAYVPLFKDIFSNLNIPFYLNRRKRIIETPEAKTILRIFNMYDKDFDRSSVMEFITSADINFAKIFNHEQEIQKSLWNTLSIEAQITRHPATWEFRLKHLLEKKSLKLKSLAAKNDTSALSFKKEIQHLENLSYFLEKIFQTLIPLKKCRKWDEFSRTVISFIDSFLLPQKTLTDIKEILNKLSELEMIQEKISFTTYKKYTEKILKETFMPRIEESGVLIADIKSYSSLHSKVIIIPGLLEKEFPKLYSANSLLLDKEKETLNRKLKKPALPSTLNSEQEEKILFKKAILGADNFLRITFPKISEETTEELIPSSLLLSLGAALLGTEVQYDTLKTIPGFTKIPLKDYRKKETAISYPEFNLKQMQELKENQDTANLLYLANLSPIFKKNIQGDLKIWKEDNYNEYTGLIKKKSLQNVLKNSLLRQEFSPTRIEQFAMCPYRYFWRYTLALKKLDDPEKIEEINKRDEGTLIHDILFDFYSQLKKENKLPLTADNWPARKNLLEKIIKKRAEAYEKINCTGYLLLWEEKKKEIKNKIENFISQEIKEKSNFIPAYFEKPFGKELSAKEEDTLSASAIISFPVKDKTVYLSGKIDRIDIDTTKQQARVIDYKTGKPKNKKSFIEGGRYIQLPIYMLAAEDLLDKINIEEAHYYYIEPVKKTKKDKPLEKRSLNKNDWNDKLSYLREVIETFYSEIENGKFFPNPDLQSCRVCDFNPICGPLKFDISERKKEDKQKEAYKKMREIP